MPLVGLVEMRASADPLLGLTIDPLATSRVVTCILHGMTNPSTHAGSAKPFLYALSGTVLLAIAGMLFVNLNEDPEVFMVLTAVFAAPGLYLIVAGAVARGIFVARR
jgi:hypothetical protein